MIEFLINSVHQTPLVLGYVQIIGMIIAAIATATTAVASHNQAQDRKGLMNYNAKVEEQEALRKQFEAKEAAKLKRKANEAFLSKQRAAYGKSKVKTTGSVLEVLSDSAEILEAEALDIERVGAHEAQMMRTRAEVSRMSGQAADTAGTGQVAGTILSGLSSTYNQSQKT